MSDMLQVLAMMAAVVAFFGTIRYLNLRAARIETAPSPVHEQSEGPSPTYSPWYQPNWGGLS